MWMHTVDVDQSVRRKVYRSILVIWSLLIPVMGNGGIRTRLVTISRRQDTDPSYKPMFPWLAIKVSSGYRRACTGMEPSRERPSEFMTGLRLVGVGRVDIYPSRPKSGFGRSKPTHLTTKPSNGR